jgi:hypothetical protein
MQLSSFVRDHGENAREMLHCVVSTCNKENSLTVTTQGQKSRGGGEMLAQDYTEAFMEWEEKFENEQAVHVKEQEQAKVDLIRAIALEQEKAEIINSSFQSVANQKEKFIGELESECNRIGTLTGSILCMIKERAINVIQGVQEFRNKLVLGLRRNPTDPYIKRKLVLRRFRINRH